MIRVLAITLLLWASLASAQNFVLVTNATGGVSLVPGLVDGGVIPIPVIVLADAGTVLPVLQGQGLTDGGSWNMTVVGGTLTCNAGAGTQTVSLASTTITGSVAVTNAGLSNLDVLLSTRTKPADQQHTIIDSSATLTCTGPLTDTQLRATPVPVSGTVTATVSNATITGQPPVFIGFDGGFMSAIQSGTWTIQPGNTANTTAWLMEGSIANNAAPSSSKPFQLAGYSWTDGTAPTATTAGNVTRLLTTTDGRLVVSQDHPKRVNCNISSTATTSTIVTGCSAPGAGLSLYVTDISIGSSIISTTTNFTLLQSGTGGTCGTGTAVLYRCFNSVAFGGCIQGLSTPIKVAANSELCFLNPGAGTRFVNLTGFIAP